MVTDNSTMQTCLKCNVSISEHKDSMCCDGCHRNLHKSCSDLSASEIKVIDLKGKRLLKFFCNCCQSGLLRIPFLLKVVEDLTSQLGSLKTKVENQQRPT
ncbi:hypothetical protein JTB14_029212 [Gonioctena quinquepunctata]|nr:hypothetical protein JTB14_029212 [Gonioctena quinquepunctata]